jgi:hypothetical protein
VATGTWTGSRTWTCSAVATRAWTGSRTWTWTGTPRTGTPRTVTGICAGLVTVVAHTEPAELVFGEIDPVLVSSSRVGNTERIQAIVFGHRGYFPLRVATRQGFGFLDETVVVDDLIGTDSRNAFARENDPGQVERVGRAQRDPFAVAR